MDLFGENLACPHATRDVELARDVRDKARRTAARMAGNADDLRLLLSALDLWPASDPH